MSQGRGLNLKDVVRHLSGRDTSARDVCISWYTSEGLDKLQW